MNNRRYSLYSLDITTLLLKYDWIIVRQEVFGVLWPWDPRVSFILSYVENAMKCCIACFILLASIIKTRWLRRDETTITIAATTATMATTTTTTTPTTTTTTTAKAKWWWWWRWYPALKLTTSKWFYLRVEIWMYWLYRKHQYWVIEMKN